MFKVLEYSIEASHYTLEFRLNRRQPSLMPSGLVPVHEFLEYIDNLRAGASREGEARATAGDVVRIMSVHAAKGLEFPIVVVGGFEPGNYPVASDYEDDGVFDERMRNERRLLYVGMSRAMRGLMVIVPEGCEHKALLNLSRLSQRSRM